MKNDSDKLIVERIDTAFNKHLNRGVMYFATPVKVHGRDCYRLIYNCDLKRHCSIYDVTVNYRVLCD